MEDFAIAAADFLSAVEASRRSIGVELQLSVYFLFVVRQGKLSMSSFPARVRNNPIVIESGKLGPYSLCPQRQEGTSHGLSSSPVCFLKIALTLNGSQTQCGSKLGIYYEIRKWQSYGMA